MFVPLPNSSKKIMDLSVHSARNMEIFWRVWQNPLWSLLLEHSLIYHWNRLSVEEAGEDMIYGIDGTFFGWNVAWDLDNK